MCDHANAWSHSRFCWKYFFVNCCGGCNIWSHSNFLWIIKFVLLSVFGGNFVEWPISACKRTPHRDLQVWTEPHRAVAYTGLIHLATGRCRRCPTCSVGTYMHTAPELWKYFVRDACSHPEKTDHREFSWCEIKSRHMNTQAHTRRCCNVYSTSGWRFNVGWTSNKRCVTQGVTNTIHRKNLLTSCVTGEDIEILKKRLNYSLWSTGDSPHPILAMLAMLCGNPKRSWGWF